MKAEKIGLYWRELLTEGLGTFILIFLGTGAVMVNQLTQGSLTHLGVSFVFGAVVTALIYATGHISGCHINPAVTLGFWTMGCLPGSKVLPYILSQCTGAIAASTVLRCTLGLVSNLGATQPLNGNSQQTLILETILTFILMFVILGSGLDTRAPKGFAGLAIGLTVGMEAACMGPITGASMNPARSLAPAVVAGVWDYQGIYWIGPIVGAQLAVMVYRLLSPKLS